MVLLLSNSMQSKKRILTAAQRALVREVIAETKPFRKMGHVTIVNEDMNKARKIAEEVKKSIKVISEI